MTWEEYERSGQHYTDQVSKMLSKMAVCERYLPVVTVNGEEAKLTNVFIRSTTGDVHGAKELVFLFQSMETSYQTDHAQTLCPVGGTIVNILRMPASDWQSDEARRIHDAVYEQYCLHA